ncbi:type IV secretory pathway TraG/TraD family ATPase VirD4 [Jatrophihabitans sp. GAS493]|uniref:type IV secretory system conjugative DNA transfer family protein n=1 Tax=Jatrophihabitans sp. GAS493 TaxID=1907575 RepID=UPI000BB7E9F6|nr:TraM recognition domain-containing protein [Jatrophihabitans sp. GAS493]SOD72926.1 type IV secretory pathway TraG/TraD family ATPase VirD4 [Jatrophihabitans sp. GAS493]
MSVQTKQPNDGLLPLILLLSGCGLMLLAWWPIVAVGHLGGRPVPMNPWRIIFGLAQHTVVWPGPAVYVLYGLQLSVVVLAAAVLLRRRGKRSKGRTRADAANRHLSRANDMVGLTPAQVRQSAQRLRPTADLTVPAQHGVMVMQTVVTCTDLRMSWEDITVVIAGPRVGKTTANVVPAIVDYNGPEVISSNKPDVHDATREIREAIGGVWLCDPQEIVGTPDAMAGPHFWWDPFADISSLSIARELVQILIDTTVDPDAKPDAYFTPTGQATLVNYVFAAALAGRTILDVDAWLGDVDDNTATTILADRGYDAAARQIKAVLAKPDRQRDGVLGTAQSWLSVITDPRYSAWITPPIGTGHARAPRFEPEKFVRSAADTIYLLSQEGPASAAFVTTAIAASIDRAGLAYTRTMPGRRLSNPVLSVLDEAANTIVDSTLPDKVSHHGSRGLPKVIVLQSWSQGVDRWGERGMRKLWSAANNKLYLGGVSETEFLKSMSDLLGERDERYWTTSSTNAGHGSSTSRSEQVRRLPIQSVAELSALPRGRAVLFSSGNRPALGRPVPWMAGPNAPAIRASLDKWETDERRNDRLAETAAAEQEAIDTELNDVVLTDRELAQSIEKEGVLL